MRFRKGTTDHDGDGTMGGSRKKQRDAADQMIFDQGRTARAGSIGRDDAPYADSKQKDLWLEGWNHEDDNRGGGRG